MFDAQTVWVPSFLRRKQRRAIHIDQIGSFRLSFAVLGLYLSVCKRSHQQAPCRRCKEAIHCTTSIGSRVDFGPNVCLYSHLRIDTISLQDVSHVSDEVLPHFPSEMRRYNARRRFRAGIMAAKTVSTLSSTYANCYFATNSHTRNRTRHFFANSFDAK